MQWIQFGIFGLLVGLVARFVLPGRDKMGIIKTMLLGIAGAFLSAWLGEKFGYYTTGSGMSFLAATLGAVVVLIVYNTLFGRNV